MNRDSSKTLHRLCRRLALLDASRGYSLIADVERVRALTREFETRLSEWGSVDELERFVHARWGATPNRGRFGRMVRSEFLKFVES